MANFADAFFSGMDRAANREAVHSQNALRAAQTQAVTDKARIEKAKATLMTVGEAAAAASTPQEWDANVDMLVQAGLSDAAQFKGRFDQREAVIRMALDGAQRYDQLLGSRMAGAVGGGPEAVTQGQNALAPTNASAVTSMPLEAPAARGEAMSQWEARKQVESGGRQFDGQGNPLQPPRAAVTDMTGGMPVGIGQIKPGTAEATARNHGIPFDEQRLASDAGYNENLSMMHQNDLSARYDANPTLVDAAYHSGAGNVDKWVERYGTPGRDIPDEEWIAKVEQAGNPRTAQYIRRIRERAAGPSGSVENRSESRLPREGAVRQAPEGQSRRAYGGRLTTAQRLALASGSGDKIAEAFKGADLDPKSDAGKVINDRQMFVAQFGEGSPQVRAFDHMARSTGAPKLSDVSGVRKEFTSLSKDFVQVRDAFGRINAAASKPDAAGDLALIFNFMKMLDPGSVVREGEFATAQNAGSIPEQVWNMYNRSLTGERLNPEQRDRFIEQAKLLYASQLAGHRRLEEQYRGLAERQGMDPSNVVVDFIGNDEPSRQDSEPSPALPPPTQASFTPQQRSEAQSLRQKYGLDLSAAEDAPPAPATTALPLNEEVPNQSPPEEAAPTNPDAGLVQPPAPAQGAPTLPNSNLAGRTPPSQQVAPDEAPVAASPGAGSAGPVSRDPNLAAVLRRSGYDAALAQQARRGRDGRIYVPDPNRPGKWLAVEGGAQQ